ncbi:hypothetical protein AJ79_07484 [Helicocarpus griseus UAMH5409]|uniref:Uncharacterized protein n=1 Tax=Helicocarpus griseus UAMH5409 TaxID=1447875 RepID=A0A2B7X2F7_9EURO|nr:hypothetical protein AJ79_07484 [Helicocarpus griseus UAMH5409]
MPTEEEFEEFRQVLVGNPKLRRQPLEPLLKERWEAEADRDAFRKWVSERSKNEMAKTSPKERALLVSYVLGNWVPMIRAGTDIHGDVYRIIPERTLSALTK